MGLPFGKWVFPVTSVPMLKSLGPITDHPPSFEHHHPLLDEEQPARNRSITQRRIELYGQTEGCSGCRLGTYLHTSECRTRFNRLLNEDEPLPPKEVEASQRTTRRVQVS